MKKKIFKIYVMSILIILFQAGYSQSFANWIKIETIPQPFADTYFLDVYFLESDPLYGWACGYGGTVIRTSDGGDTWNGVYVNNVDQLESIDFVDSKNGYTSGEGKIYKSTDGGITWGDVTPVQSTAMLWGNFFISIDTGFVIGDGCIDRPQRFYKTTNSGRTWTEFSAFVSNSGLSDILMLSGGTNGVGYAGSSGKIWKTTNGGDTWSVLSVTGGEDWQEELTVFGNSFLVPYSEGCMGGGPGGGMRFSTDYGKTWRQYKVGTSMFGAFLIDSLRGWVCGWKMSVYYTNDGGKTWNLRNCGIEQEADLDDIWFINDTLGFLVGKGVYKTHSYDSLNPEISSDKSYEICEGDSVTLSTKDNYSYYSWSTGETTSSIVVKSGGNYWVKVANSVCDSTFSPTVKVIVFPKPNVNILASDTAVCDGDTIILSANGGYLEYRWSKLLKPTGKQILGDNSNSVKVTEKGTYELIVIDENGCIDTAQKFIDIYPNPKPDIQLIGRMIFCNGDSVTLQATDGYSVYNWYQSPSTLIVTGKRQIIFHNSGKYYVKVRNQYGCENTSDEIEISTIEDSNRVEISSVSNDGCFDIDSTNLGDIKCRNLTITNKADEVFIIDNIFLFRNIEFSIPQTQLPITIPPKESVDIQVCYSPTALGMQTDTLLFIDKCSDQIVPLRSFGRADFYDGISRCDVPLKFTSIKLGKYQFISMEPYPNPGKNKISIVFSRYIPENAEAVEFCTLYNSLGTIVKEANMKIIIEQESEYGKYQEGEFIFNTEGLCSGMYIAAIRTAGKIITYSVIVER